MDNQMLNFYRNALLGNISGEPLCQQYKQAWRACGDDKEMLVRLALSQQAIPFASTACYEKLGVTKSYIMTNFAEYINGNKVFHDVEGVNGYTYELYVGYEGILEAAADVLSLMWCNSTFVEIEATKCPNFYVSNKSNVHFSLEGYNSVTIHLFDESVITIDECDENCQVTVFRYSDRAVVNKGRRCLGKVKVFDKKLRL